MQPSDAMIEAACAAYAEGLSEHLTMEGKMGKALTAALAQGAVEAEPVAWQWRYRAKTTSDEWNEWSGWRDGYVEPYSAPSYQSEARPLFASPPELERVTRERDEEREKLANFGATVLSSLRHKPHSELDLEYEAEAWKRQAESAEYQLAEARAQLAALSREGGK